MKRLLALVLTLLMAGPVAAQASHSLELLRGEDVGIVPRYLLQDPNGRAISHEEFRGRFQLIAFGYTYCPDICPTTLARPISCRMPVKISPKLTVSSPTNTTRGTVCELPTGSALTSTGRVSVRPTKFPRTPPVK